jgi:hypothetical protein
MSVEQLAIDTKIPRASIDALEEDRFTALPGPVFVKGFFRCCARSLSLDAEVVMALLHEHERAQQQLKSGGRRERQAPQLLGRAASARPATGASASVGLGAGLNAGNSGIIVPTAGASGPIPGAPGTSRVPAAPVHAVPGEAVVAAPPALFDIRGLAPLVARVVASLQLARLSGLVRDASNSRLLMWIAVSLLIALIVVTAFVMAGGTGPGLPQS